MRARTAGPASPPQLHVHVKANTSVAGDGAAIVLPDASGAALFTHNGCLAVVIGRDVRSLPPARWRDAVFGYSAVIDVTARTEDATRWKDGRSCLGGSFDTFTPLGPWIVPRTAVDDAAGFAVRLRVDGETRQDYRLADLDREIGETVALASSVMTLHPGDVIAIPGPADGQGPLQDGDRIELDAGPVGRLHATVSDRLGRRWPRDLRLDASADDTDVRALVQ
jgi:2-keto-4-pentenoate hydratase/2-oxohepta-3-ene-1,7-dioic acid hydratase in catechol pathway